MPATVIGKIGHPAEPVKEGYISAREAAAFLGMSIGWLRNSDVPYHKFGSRRVYSRQDLHGYAEAHRSHSLRVEEP